MTDRCPDPSILESLLSGLLGDSQQSDLERHINECAECQSRLQSLADIDSVMPKSLPPPGLKSAADSARLGEVVVRNARPVAALRHSSGRWPY